MSHGNVNKILIQNKRVNRRKEKGLGLYKTELEIVIFACELAIH